MAATPHEDRFIEVLQLLTGGEVAQEISIPRKARRLDAVCRFGQAGVPGLFGRLQPACEERVVAFEHESAPLTKEAVASAWVGLAWLSWNRMRTHRGRRPAVHALLAHTVRPPLTILVADTVREDLTGAVPALDRAAWPGLWATPDTGGGLFHHGGLLVVDTSTVPLSDGFSFWRWLGRARTEQEANARLVGLLADPNLPTIGKNQLQEAIMNHQIEATDTERETIADRVRRLAREEGREEGLATAREALLAVAARWAPDALPALRAIADFEVLQREVHTVLARELGG
jgi:hypothetical protein